MVQIRKSNIVHFFFLWLFITPVFIKTFHRHEPEFHCTAMGEKHFHVLHESCPICAFQFSYFRQDHKIFNLCTNLYHKEIILLFKEVFVIKSHHLALLLRSPPLDNESD